MDEEICEEERPVSSQPGCLPLPIATSSKASPFHDFQAYFTCLPSLHHPEWLSSACAEIRKGRLPETVLSTGIARWLYSTPGIVSHTVILQVHVDIFPVSIIKALVG